MSKKPLTLAIVLVAAVGARGLFIPTPLSAAGSWVNVTGNLANMPSGCGNLTVVAPVPGANSIVSGVVVAGLWASSGNGTWSHLGDGLGSAVIDHGPIWIVFDPANPATFWEAGIHGAHGVYKTTDGGNTFQILDTTGNTVRQSDYVSVDFTDPNRQTLVAGGHEEQQTVWKSIDGGQNWTNVGMPVPLGGFTSNPLAVDAQTYLVSASGVYRTTNGGSSWQQVSTQSPGGAPLVASDGAIYWPMNGSLLKSIDAGMTWNPVGSGIQGIHPIELANGNLVSSNGSNLMLSADGGATWNPVGPTMPYQPAGVAFSPGLNAYFIWHGDCGNFVLPDAVMKLDLGVLPIPAAPTGLTIHLN